MTWLNFTPDPNFKPKTGFDLIPTGDEIVQINKVEEKRTKGGHALVLTFQVLHGSYKNRRFWVYLNVEHHDPVVQQRAHDELNSLCKAMNVTGELTSESLCNKPLTARIYQTQAKDGYEAKNSARNFRSTNWLYPPELVTTDEPARAPAPAPAPKAVTQPEVPAARKSAVEMARELMAKRAGEAERLSKTLPDNLPF